MSRRQRKPTDIPAALKSIDVPAILRRRGIYAYREKNQELRSAAMPLARKLAKQKYASPPVLVVEKEEPGQRHTQFTNDQLQAYWEKQIHVVESIEAKFENKLVQFIQDVEEGFLKSFDTEVNGTKDFTTFAQKDYFSDNEDNLLVKAELDFGPLLQSVTLIAGNEANKLIGLDEPYLADEAKAQIRINIERFTKSMLDTDRQILIDIVTNGLENGNSVPEIRNEIQAKFSTYSKTQAQRITRTEVIRASNQGALDAYKASGVVEAKQWLTFGAVDECAQYDGQIESLDTKFYKGGNEFQDGNPPLHPNCRCVVVPIVMGAKAYQPDNTRLVERVKELEAQVDKRTKAYKTIKQEYREKQADDKAYINALEKHLGTSHEQ